MITYCLRPKWGRHSKLPMVLVLPGAKRDENSISRWRQSDETGGRARIYGRQPAMEPEEFHSLWSTCDDPFGATRFPQLSRKLTALGRVLQAWRNLVRVEFENQNPTLTREPAASRQLPQTKARKTHWEGS